MRAWRNECSPEPRVLPNNDAQWHRPDLFVRKKLISNIIFLFNKAAI